MLSHLCRECGTDLAVERAALEPVYGFLIVRCPTCASVATRRRHPVLRRWLTLRRTDWALTVLAANLVALVALVFATSGSIFWITVESFERTPVEMWKHDSAQMVVTMLILPVLAGTWLTSGLSHWRRPAAWLTFAALIAGILAFVTATVILDQSTEREFNRLWLTGPLHQLRLCLALLVLFMLVATAGIGPGLILLRLLRAGRHAQWRWRRKRGRRERA